MGRVKDGWMEAQERGWNEIEMLVCQNCVNEPDLWRLAPDDVVDARCDYCNADLDVLPVSSIQEALYSVVEAYYANPDAAGVPSMDGGYLVEPVDLSEVLWNLGFDPVSKLREDIVDADLVEAWVPAADGHWAEVHPHEVLLSSWSTFASVVKHQTRFHFQRVAGDRHSQDVGVADMLEVIGDELKTLVRVVDPGIAVYRARHLSEEEYKEVDAGVMGAPPKEFASAGRMNPAGIPYFYAAFDLETAFSEIGHRPDDKVSVAGAFVVTRPLRIVDLTQLPESPSLFALDLKDDREKAMFLEGFVQSITKPVRKDGREHIDYVPSQVVCEYLAQSQVLEGEDRLEGLMFPSAINRGGFNLVVFPVAKWFERERFDSLAFGGVAERRG